MGNSFESDSEIVALTALRAFAAWWVVAYHFKVMTPTTEELDWTVLNLGWIGVDIFFALSGFVLGYVYDAELKGGSYSHRAFLIRRLARIYPMHIFTLGVVLLMALASLAAGVGLSVESHLRPQGDYNPAVTLIAQVLLVHAWGIDTVGHFNAPSWSISVEWFAYLLFPVFALIWLRWRMSFAITAAVVALVLVSMISTAAFDKPPANLLEQFGFLRIIPEFAFGILAFRFYRGPSSGRAVAWLAIGGGLVAIDITLGLGYYTIPLAAVFVVYGASAVPKSGRVLHYLGKISYSTYMVHMPVMFVAWPIFNRVGAGGLLRDTMLMTGAVVMVLVASMLAYHLVESPAERQIKRIARSRSLL